MHVGPCYPVHMVAKDERSFFTFDAETSARLRRITLRLGAERGKRVTYAEILGRALDALERELAAGKPAPRKGRK